MINAKFRIPLLILALVLVPLLWGLIFPGSYPSRQSASRSFTIGDNFTVVRKILVRKDGAKQIISMGGDCEFIDQQWRAVGGEVNSLKLFEPNWLLELHGTLNVRTLDEYVGKLEVELDQEVKITVDKVDSQVRLKEPVERLRDYEMTTLFSRTEDDQTQIKVSLEQEIRTNCPWFAHFVADRFVLESVEKTLANQEAGIRQLIAENRNDVPFFPLK